ncbi:hypothetical protein IOLA_216 [uncultured bacterium]|nr:hypothetical protein IOLA_216 [uncultured bacterium]
MRNNKNINNQVLLLLNELKSNNKEVLIKISQLLPKRKAKSDDELDKAGSVVNTCKYMRIESLMKESKKIGVMNDILFLLTSDPDKRKHYVLMVDNNEASVALKIRDTPLMSKEEIMQISQANENLKKNRTILASV